MTARLLAAQKYISSSELPPSPFRWRSGDLFYFANRKNSPAKNDRAN